MNFTVTVTLNGATGVNVDNPDGTTTLGTASVGVPGCVIWPAQSTENVQGQDNVLTGLTLLAPPGTVIKSTDTVTIAGLTYNVVGDPFEWVSPLTGTAAGVQVALTRAH